MNQIKIGRLCAVAMIALILSGFGWPALAGDPLQVTLNKTTILRIARDASTVAIGNPEVADISVESPRLILLVGKQAGETNLLILDASDAEIHDFNLVVVPESARHLTVHRGATEVTTFNCEPRCTAVKTPGEPLSGDADASGSAGDPLSSLSAQSDGDAEASSVEE